MYNDEEGLNRMNFSYYSSSGTILRFDFCRRGDGFTQRYIGDIYMQLFEHLLVHSKGLVQDRELTMPERGAVRGDKVAVALQYSA